EVHQHPAHRLRRGGAQERPPGPLRRRPFANALSGRGRGRGPPSLSRRGRVPAPRAGGRGGQGPASQSGEQAPLRGQGGDVPMASPESERPGPWYEGVTAAQWLVLVIASAGWIFDVYEGQLFAIFKTPALSELLGGGGPAVTWHSFLASALFLVGGAIG